MVRYWTGWQQVNVRLAKLKVPPSMLPAGVCAAPPSNRNLPVGKVPGWRAFGFPPALWAAPRRMPGAEEADGSGTPPWWPDAYVLPGSPLLLFTCSWSWWYPRV